MSDFTGTVNQYGGKYFFDNDDGTAKQRLTKADLGGDYQGQEIDLEPYDGQNISVNGQWEHDWILKAEIVEENESKS
jgi:hypothetical protein